MKTKRIAAGALLALGVGIFYCHSQSIGGANTSKGFEFAIDNSRLVMDEGITYLQAPDGGMLSDELGPPPSMESTKKLLQHLTGSLVLYMKAREEGEVLSQHLAIIESMEQAQRQKFGKTLPTFHDMIEDRELDARIFLDSAQNDLDALTGFLPAKLNPQRGPAELDPQPEPAATTQFISLRH